MTTYGHWMTPECRVMAFNDPDFDPGHGAEPINSGIWLPRLILDRLAGDTKCYVRFFEWSQAEHFDPSSVQNGVFWGDPGGIVWIEVESPRYTGVSSPLDALGLVVSNDAKLTKRLKELVRLTRYFAAAPANVKYFKTTTATEKWYDGISIVRRSYAKKMGLTRHHKRVSFRYLDGNGLIKGDAIIISDALMESVHGPNVDVVTADVNLKTQVRTMGWKTATANPHHAHGQALFDVQSAAWLREWLYPRRQIMETFTTVVDQYLTDLRNGVWPTWLQLTTAAKEAGVNSSILPPEETYENFRRQFTRWQSYGLKLEHSASLMGMAAQAFLSKLLSALNFEIPETNELGETVWVKKPKLWLPLPWASYGHVITHQVLKLAGFKIPKGCANKVFYHEETASFSVPGRQFADTFEAHGTWDLDDSAKFFLRKVAGDAEVLGMKYKKGETIVLIVRSPNANGEYSIHKVGNISEFPRYHQYGEMPEIDLAKAPARIEHVQMGQKMLGMPFSARVSDPTWTVDEMEYSVELQAKNPGFGAIANALMVYDASLGHPPTTMLASVGEIVDCTQQGGYEEGFAAIPSFTKTLWNEISNYGLVDSYLFTTRVPRKIRESGALRVYEGYFTSLYRHFVRETERFDASWKPIGFQVRHENPIPEVMSMEFAPEVMAEANRLVNKMDAARARVLDSFKAPIAQATPRVRPLFIRARTKQLHLLVNRMVNQLNRMDELDADTLVLAMYRTCLVSGAPPHVWGQTDHALFAPADEWQITVMDFLTRALLRLGVAQEPNNA